MNSEAFSSLKVSSNLQKDKDFCIFSATTWNRYTVISFYIYNLQKQNSRSRTATTNFKTETQTCGNRTTPRLLRDLLMQGDPKSRTDGKVKRRNRGITERRKITLNPKRRSCGITERRKITPNPKKRNHGTAKRRKIPPNPNRRNDGKSPEILQDEITENRPKS